MGDNSNISIKLAAVLSVHKAVFWRTEIVNKNMTVQNLIETRLPDMSYFDSEDVYALCMRTNTILDKDKKIGYCDIYPGEKIKIVVFSKEEANKYKSKWRVTHPSCRFST